jgi:hypothetical protein
MLSQAQLDRVATLNDDQARTLLRRHLKIIPPENEPATPLLMRLISSANMDHRSLLRPLFRTQLPAEINILETVAGRPIQHIRKITKHVGPVRPGRPKPPKPDDDRLITNIVPNPKKLGSASYDRYARYVEGMTVSQALSAGITSGDLKWDEGRGFITIG